jgi:hypothetical protein
MQSEDDPEIDRLERLRVRALVEDSRFADGQRSGTLPALPPRAARTGERCGERSGAMKMNTDFAVPLGGIARRWPTGGVWKRSFRGGMSSLVISVTRVT